MYQTALYFFHLVYFISYGVSSFFSKYFGEIGMSDWQIGMLSSTAIVGVLFQPFWGTLADRLRYKKTLLVFLLAAFSCICFWVEGKITFPILLAGMTIFSIVQLPLAPIYSTISLEYMRQIQKPYGPLRLVGTIGYQAGALMTGAIFVVSLQGIFKLMGIVALVSCVTAFGMPPIEGHQYKQKKTSLRVLLYDKHIMFLLIMILFGSITSQFYMSFFAKHMGDIGISNQQVSIIIFLSVLMELPFLMFADKLSRKTNIWNWILIGYAINAARYLGLSLTKNVPLLMLFQLPGMSIMACFEFFPALYLNVRAPTALKASAQTLLMVVSFGISKVIGSMLGGFLSSWVGIPAVFAINSVMLLVALVVCWQPTRKLIASEGNILNETASITA